MTERTSGNRRLSGRWAVAVAVVIAALAALLVYRARTGDSTDPVSTNPEVATTAPAAPATTQTATIRDAGPTVPRTYVDVVRATYPDLPATRPFAIPLDLPQAAHLKLTDRVHLSTPPRVDLWITRGDAPPTEEVLRAAMNPDEDVQTHLTREQVVFVHWQPVDTGQWPPYLVCRGRGGGYEIVSPSRRQMLPGRRAYRWDRALSWNENVIVPTDTGISILRFEPEITESFQSLTPEAGDGAGTRPPTVPSTGPSSQPLNRASSASDPPEPQYLLDWEGLIAWLPWENGKPGGRGAARYVDGKWSQLGPEQGWHDKILHLVPLLDGSVLQLVVGEKGPDTVRLSLTSLEKAEVDEDKIRDLVDQLSDDDPVKRQAAYDELTKYGPGVYDLLQELSDAQPPEAKIRLRQLLKNKVQPTLGGMTLRGDKLRLVSRLPDGGALFYAEQGVTIPAEDGPPTPRIPAWLSVRPGRFIELLDLSFTRDLDPAKARVVAFDNEWVVTHDARGPLRYLANGFVPLLRKDEAAFSELVGIDRRGRWLFRKPVPSLAERADAAANGPGGEVLILDPTLPDPTPRLPAWEYTSAESVGWDKDNWPAVKRGGAWALHEEGWKPLEKNARMFTKPEEIPSSPSSTRPTTGVAPSTTAPVTTAPLTTRPVASTGSSSDDEPLLIDADGTRYLDGVEALRVVDASGNETVWSLPATATGREPVTLLRATDGLLFLFNQPGRVLRIRRTPDGGEPFRVEATFTRKIPSAPRPTRIWLDPAGRIIIAHGNRLTILFPSGFIPPAIQKMMPAQGDDLFAP